MILAKGLVFVLALATAQAQPITEEPTGDKKTKGRLIPMDVDNPIVLRFANFSLRAINAYLGQLDPHEPEPQLIKVTEAFKQVVDGMHYHINLQVWSPKIKSQSCNVQVLIPLIGPGGVDLPEPRVTGVICFKLELSGNTPELIIEPDGQAGGWTPAEH